MCEYFSQVNIFRGEYFSGVNISQFKFRIRTDYFGLVVFVFVFLHKYSCFCLCLQGGGKAWQRLEFRRACIGGDAMYQVVIIVIIVNIVVAITIIT